MKLKKGLVVVLVLALASLLQSCEKKSDSVSGAVMAPYGSTISMGTGVPGLVALTSSSWWFVEYRVMVLGPDKKPMNGIGINLSTSSSYAYFAGSGSAVDVVKTDVNGTALVVVIVLGGQYFNDYPDESSLPISVWADIVVDDDVSDITVTKGANFV